MRWSKCLLSLFAACSVGLAGPAAAQNPIRIGYPVILSGPGALIGEPSLKGAQMFVEETNAKGGVFPQTPSTGCASGSVGLDPAVPREGEACQLLPEILDHVVALEFPVHQHVYVEFLLDAHRVLRLLLQKRVVGRVVEVTLAMCGTCLAHLRRLRE